MPATAVASILTSQLVSGFDVHKPERLAKLFKRFGDQGLTWFTVLDSMGFRLPVANDEYSHNEEDRYHDVLTVDANVGAPGAGNDISFTLSAASLDANNNFYVRLWDTLMFPNEVTGQVVAINTAVPAAPVITVRPNLLTDAIPALTAGDEIIITSNAFSEGSANPIGAISGTTKFTNYAQIIKETFSVTGSEMTNQTWLQLKEMADAPYYFEGQTQADYRYALKMDGALLFGKPTTNTAMVDPVTGASLVGKTTEGLIPAIRRRGNTIVSAPGTWGIPDFDNMTRIFDREGQGRNILSMLGLNKSQENSNMMKSYFNNTNIEMAVKTIRSEVFGGSESMQATLDFKYLIKEDYNFMFSKLGQFTNPKLYGATGYDMKNYGVFLPVAKLKDPKSGKLMDNIGVRYKKLAGTNRMLEVWNGDSGAGPIKVTSVDKMNTYWRGHVGAHQMGVNGMILVATQ